MVSSVLEPNRSDGRRFRCHRSWNNRTISLFRPDDNQCGVWWLLAVSSRCESRRGQIVEVPLVGTQGSCGSAK